MGFDCRVLSSEAGGKVRLGSLVLNSDALSMESLRHRWAEPHLKTVLSAFLDLLATGTTFGNENNS